MVVNVLMVLALAGVGVVYMLYEHALTNHFFDDLIMKLLA